MITRIILIVVGIVAVAAGVLVIADQAMAPSSSPDEMAVTTTASDPEGTPDVVVVETVAPDSDNPAVASSPTHEPVSPIETPTAASMEVSPLVRAGADPPIFTYEIVAEYPHDPEAWTQGLVYTNGILYEGTGLRGQSSLRKVDLESGVPYQVTGLADEYFGEGITVYDDKIYQLTWKANQGFIYDADDFSELDTFSYPTEGWGLTHDGSQLIMSDGTSNLYFRDPETMQETRRVQVRTNRGLVQQLNELEYVNGEVFANVWHTDWIVRIDPETGEIVGIIDLRGLLSPEDRDGNVNVLNGIAYDAENDRLFVTGKLWPKLFEIELVPLQ